MQKKNVTPYAYFITFSCYGARLHAGNLPSVDRHHNIHNTPRLEANPTRNIIVQQRMKEQPYLLDAPRRELTLCAIMETARFFNWKLFAAHVRTNHAHLIISSNVSAEFVMNTMKSYASRYLNNANIDHGRTKRWARHGSTRNLWDIKDVSSAINYVVNEQGKPMAVFEYT